MLPCILHQNHWDLDQQGNCQFTSFYMGLFFFFLKNNSLVKILSEYFNSTMVSRECLETWLPFFFKFYLFFIKNYFLYIFRLFWCNDLKNNFLKIKKSFWYISKRIIFWTATAAIIPNRPEVYITATTIFQNECFL